MTQETILAIDPGPSESGWCLYRDGRVLKSGVAANPVLRGAVKHNIEGADVLAIEMVQNFGMPVGAEVFSTCLEIGRYVEAWHDPEAVRLVFRKDVKLLLCGTARAKDPNVRAALIDLIGPPGTKRDPGPTYGVKSHAWSALAVAVTAAAHMEAI